MFGHTEKLAKLTGAGVLLAGMIGCTVDVYSPPPREVVVSNGPADEDVVVDEAPPPPEVDVEGDPPGVGFVWVDGEWIRHGGRWEWTHGHWDHPPHAGARWVRGRWDHGDHGYARVRGHWE